MAFPSSPTNGQTHTLDNITYTYSSSLNMWSVTTFNELNTPTKTSIVATGSSTFSVPAGAKILEITCVGPGGGGGGGARNASGSTSGGGAGGGGGGISRYIFSASDLGGAGASLTISVGAGGAGGNATTPGTSALAGNIGVSGGFTYMTYSSGRLYATGGGRGSGGSTNSTATRGNPGSGLYQGNLGNNGPTTSASLSLASSSPGAGGGGCGIGGTSTYLTGGVPSATNLTPQNTASAAGPDGELNTWGGGGGAGASSSTTTPATAGAGGFPGGGGGGGGEGSTAGASGAGGAGGAGGNGAVYITVWYG